MLPTGSSHVRGEGSEHSSGTHAFRFPVGQAEPDGKGKELLRMIRNQYHETQFKQWPASESHCSVDLKIISSPSPCPCSVLRPIVPPQSLCVLNPNEWSLNSSSSPKSIISSPPFNWRVLINVGKVICQVCFACGFLRLKATGNSSSVRRASAVFLSPEGGFSSADSRRHQLLIWSYWILTHHSQQNYGPAFLDPGNWALALPSASPTPPFSFCWT